MTNLPERREMRISDADRDGVAAILRDAAGDGRLDLEELDERLTAVYAAKTYGDLEPLTRDLPATSSAPVAPRGGGDQLAGVPTSRFAIGVMSGFERKGPWIVPKAFNVFTYWGGGRLDLREARFAEPVVTIRAWAVMGGVEILVPEDAEVHVTGIGIMGGFDHRASGVGKPGAPRIIVKGLAFWGGVGVRRRATDAELRRRRAERKRLRQDRRGRLEE